MSDKVALGMHARDVNDDLFKSVVTKIKPNAKLKGFKAMDIKISEEDSQKPWSSLTMLEAGDNIILGLHAFRLHYSYVAEDGNEKDEFKDVVLKVRKETSAFQQDWGSFFGSLSETLRAETLRVSGNVFWKYLTPRDLHCLTLTDHSPFKAILPEIFHMTDNREQQVYAYVMDNFMSPNNGYTHLDRAESPSDWTDADIHDVLKALADMHGHFLGRIEDLPERVACCLDPSMTHAKLMEIKPLIEAHHAVVLRDRPEFFPQDMEEVYQKAWTNSDKIFNVLENVPQTLTQDDCTIRNMCKRTVTKPGQSNVVLFDWEFARIFPPQRDIVEFLMLWLPADVTVETWYKYLKIYNEYLQEAVKARGNVPSEVAQCLEWDKFKEVSDMCLLDFFLLKFNMYMTVTVLVELPFLKRCFSIRNTLLRHLTEVYEFLK